MTIKATISAVALAAALTIVTMPIAGAQDAIKAPGVKTIGVTESSKTKMIPSLAVLNSDGATLKDGVLTMTGMSHNSIVFADRPFRAAGHVLTSEFIKQWGEGKDSFAADPPNATISVLSGAGDTIEDAVVVLKMPHLNGDTLTFDVSVLEGNLDKADGPASLFIDWFAARGGYGGGVAVGGVDHDAVWHGGWYGHPADVGGFAAGAVAGAAVGTAIGAAAAAPPPPCGYYPYPACY